MSTTLTTAEAQNKLDKLIEMAQAGHEVIIEHPQKGKARLVPVSNPEQRRPRVFGLHTGEVWMSSDFNAPLPDSYWTGEKHE